MSELDCSGGFNLQNFHHVFPFIIFLKSNCTSSSCHFSVYILRSSSLHFSMHFMPDVETLIIFHFSFFTSVTVQKFKAKKILKNARRTHLLIKKARSKRLSGQSSRSLAVKRSKFLSAWRKRLPGQSSKLSAVDQGKVLKLTITENCSFCSPSLSLSDG